MSITPTTVRARSAQLIVEGATVHRGGRTILNKVELTIAAGSRWGVVGENGRGKTTLLRMLAGELVPDAGSVSRIGTIGRVDQELTVTADSTVGDLIDTELADTRLALRRFEEATVALADGGPGADLAYAAALEQVEAIDAWDADRRVDVALEALGAVTDRDRKLIELSVGQRYRVRLACLLGARHDFLLLDEPTNHLDLAGLEFLTARLRETTAAVVLVSHDRALLADVVASVLDLDPSVDGRPRSYGGGYLGYREGRAAELERWATEYERQRSEHDRLTQDLSAAQNRLVTGWRPDKGTGKHQRATRAPGVVRSVHRRRDELAAHAVTMPCPPQRFRMPEAATRPGVLVRADEVTVDHRLHQKVSLALESGQRLLVAGPNGAGKSTLLAVLAGVLPPASGAVHRTAGVRCSLLSQESAVQESALSGERPAREVFAAHVAGLVRAGTFPESAAVSLKSLELLPSDSVSTPVARLSMGQQRRLDPAMALATRPHVLLLDEPTNHLSMALVDELTEALDQTLAAVVVATHDRQLRRDLQHWPELTVSPRATSGVPDRW